MPQQVNNPEAGLRNHRTEFVREDSIGVIPTDPEYKLYSDTITETSWAPDATNSARRGLGDADPTEFMRGPETHEITVVYDLVKWLGSATGDAAYDGIARDDDNLLPSSHAFIDREDKSQIASESTVAAAGTARGTRLYTVGKGGLIDEVALTGDPSDSQPISVELSYVFQNVRTYQIDQPDSQTYLVVSSSSSNDTSQSVTIEDEGSTTSETLTLNGTSVVSTSSQFSDIDAVHLDSETEGDVTVSMNTGTEASPTEGDALMTIKGSDSYNGIQGDRGVPPMNSGTREQPGDLGDVETFLGDVIRRSASPVPYEIQSMTLTISNNIETSERVEAFGLAVYPGNRNITAEATVYGETATHDLLEDHLTSVATDISWEMDGGTVTIQQANLTEPGERAAETGQAIMTTDNTFTGTGISFN